MPDNELIQFQLESALKADDVERALGDVLDVKASVAVVALTFLAGLSLQIMGLQGLPTCFRLIQLFTQLVVLILLALGGVMIVIELLPVNYAFPPTPAEDAEWIEKLKEALPFEPEKVLETVQEQTLLKAIGRVTTNKLVSERKSRLISRAFGLLVTSMSLILINLLCLMIRTVVLSA